MRYHIAIILSVICLNLFAADPRELDSEYDSLQPIGIVATAEDEDGTKYLIYVSEYGHFAMSMNNPYRLERVRYGDGMRFYYALPKHKLLEETLDYVELQNTKKLKFNNRP